MSTWEYEGPDEEIKELIKSVKGGFDEYKLE